MPSDDNIAGENNFGVGEEQKAGHVINIAYYNEENSCFELNSEALKAVLTDPDIRDLPVSPISISGAFRQGKSFLMSMLLDYLKNDSNIDWESAESVVKGFEYRGGVARTTVGIDMWSKPFVVTRDDGRKVAVLLLDTQGIFDTQTSQEEFINIFALTLLTSSKFIFNVHFQIQEDDLSNILYFAEYGKFLIEKTGSKPFQNLTFVVRDWQWAEYDYGVGNAYLDKILDESKVKNDDLKLTRTLIKELFSELHLFLLPHPGKGVTSSTFDGSCEKIDSEFKKAVAITAENIFNKNQIEILKINDSEVKASELLFYMQNYMKVFHSRTLPEPKSIFIATSEANNLTALIKSKQVYIENMDKFCTHDGAYMNKAKLDKIHQKYSNEALMMFKSTKKMGDKEFCRTFEEKLMDEIKILYEKYEIQNESRKNVSITSLIFKMMSASLAIYVFSIFFKLIGLKTLAKLFTMLSTTIIFLLVVCLVSKTTGEFTAISDEIEGLVNHIGANILSNVLSLIVQHFPQSIPVESQK